MRGAGGSKKNKNKMIKPKMIEPKTTDKQTTDTQDKPSITNIFNHPFVEEILQPQELQHLIDTNTQINHYIGFEISGTPHLGSGIITMGVIKALHEINANTTIFLADWHSWINKKLGGDLKFIQKVALGYFKEMMIASAKVLGVDDTKINFVLGDKLYKQNPDHWANFMEANMHTTLARVKRSIGVAGRKEGEAVTFAQLTYPTLQVADIFTLQAHIAHAGMDQRKAHVIARQVAEHMTIMPLKDANGKVVKPIAIHHKLVPSLSAPSKWPITPEEAKQLIKSGDAKMSKSKPEGAIFIPDSPDDIKRKVLKAFCPEGDLTYNPVAEWVKTFVFDVGNELFIKRPEKWGGNLTIKSWQEFKEIFEAKALHPQDLKQAFAEYLIEFMKPARDYLGNLKDIEKLKQEIQERITR